MRVITFFTLLILTGYVFAESSIELGAFHVTDSVSSNASDDDLLRVFSDAKKKSSDGRVFISTLIVFAYRSEMTNACSELLAQGVPTSATRVSKEESDKSGHACYVFFQIDADDYASVKELVSVVESVASQYLGQYSTLTFLVPVDSSKSVSNT